MEQDPSRDIALQGNKLDSRYLVDLRKATERQLTRLVCISNDVATLRMRLM